MSDSRLIAFVNGARQGIGFEIASQLAQTGNFHVYLAARTIDRAQEAIDQLLKLGIASDILHPVAVELASDQTILAASETVRNAHGHLDILINSAAVHGKTTTYTRANLASTFDTNVLGVAAMIDAFTPLLQASTYAQKRIVNVSTGLGRISYAAQDSFMGARALPALEYRVTKAAMNMLSVVKARTLEPEGIAVVMAAPGHCRTAFTEYNAPRTAEQGAAVIVRAATEGDNKAVSGTYISETEQENPGW